MNSNLVGYSLSLMLHTAVLAAVFFWPSAPRVDPARPAMQISLSLGAPGGDKLVSAVLGKQGSMPDRPEAKPLDAARDAQKAPAAPMSRPQTPVSTPAAVQAPSRPAPKPEARPAPASQSEAVRLPRPDTAVEPESRPVPKPEPEKKTDSKAEPKSEPKTAPKPEKKSEQARKPDKPARPSGSDAVRRALASSRREAASPVAGALSDLRQEATGGGAGEGDGPGGGGLNDVYAGQVILAVRPNWSMATYSRTPLTALVRVRLDAQGTVLDASLERSSGRPDFDASTVNAVIRTKKLPKPPTKAQQDLLLTFNSLELAGR